MQRLIFAILLTLFIVNDGIASVLLSRNTNTVAVAPYDTVDTSGSSVGTSGAAESENFEAAHHYRIRQSGTVTKVSIYTQALTNLTGIYVRFYRRTWYTYTLVAETENLLPSCTAGQINTITLATPISDIREGDYVSYRVVASVSTAGIFKGHATTAGVANKYYTFTPTAAIGGTKDWDSLSVVADQLVPIGVFMQAPHIVYIGDSILSGNLQSRTYVEEVTTTVEKEMSRHGQGIPVYVNNILGETAVYQNMAIGGQTSTNIRNRFTADVLNAYPRYAVVMAGTNDLASTATVTYQSNMTTIMSACTASNVRLILLSIPPDSGASDDEHVTRNTWNTWLSTTCKTYSGCAFVNLDPVLGKNRAAGPAGNLNDLQSDLEIVPNDTHGNFLFNFKVAQSIANAIVKGSTTYTNPGQGTTVY